MFFLFYRFLVACVVVLFFANFLYAQDWNIAGKRGMMTFVVVAKEREKEENLYKEVIEDLCKEGEFCKIMFWSNSEDVPKSWPMTDHENNSKVADYYYNGNSGEIKFVFKFSEDN
jgi:hypothetical protein